MVTTRFSRELIFQPVVHSNKNFFLYNEFVVILTAQLGGSVDSMTFLDELPLISNIKKT